MLYQCYICDVKPFPKSQNRILIFNEFFFMCLMYMELYLATGPTFDDAWICGYVIMGWPVIVIFVNVTFIIIEMLTAKALAKNR